MPACRPDVVEPLRTFQYPDGKRPLDFVDVINVHFYSGQEPPETCKTDGNAKVTGTTTFPRTCANWPRGGIATHRPSPSG